MTKWKGCEARISASRVRRGYDVITRSAELRTEKYFFRCGPERTRTRRLGANFWASPAQLWRTLLGARMRLGRLAVRPEFFSARR